VQRFELTLIGGQSEEEVEHLYGEVIGKLIIHTHFGSNPFRLPVNIQESSTLIA